MREVVTTVVGNGMKVTGAGHVLITVKCEHQEAQTARMQISVSDTGIGIPDEKLAKIFEKFSQADESTTRRYGGSGLGLAISKQLLALMGGSIDVTSPRRAGSTLWVALSLGPREEPCP